MLVEKISTISLIMWLYLPVDSITTLSSTEFKITSHQQVEKRTGLQIENTFLLVRHQEWAIKTKTTKLLQNRSGNNLGICFLATELQFRMNIV